MHHLYTMCVPPIRFSMLSIVSRFGCAWLYYGIVLLTTSLIQNDPHCGKFSACTVGSMRTFYLTTTYQVLKKVSTHAIRPPSSPLGL